MSHEKGRGMKAIVTFFATWGYLGLSPKAPGTVGTLGALPLVYFFFLLRPTVYVYMGVVFAFVALAILICVAYEKFYNTHDPKEIVIDEVVGFLVAITWLPISWQSVTLAFVVFRFFDIVKPFPIGWIDKNIKSGAGVVADDVLAGIFTNIILQWIYINTSWLGAQFSG